TALWGAGPGSFLSFPRFPWTDGGPHERVRDRGAAAQPAVLPRAEVVAAVALLGAGAAPARPRGSVRRALRRRRRPRPVWAFRDRLPRQFVPAAAEAGGVPVLAARDLRHARGDRRRRLGHRLSPPAPFLSHSSPNHQL